jgi:hypothetical protein
LSARDLLAQVAFGENSDLYQTLVLKEQKVETLGSSFDDQGEPMLLIATTLKTASASLRASLGRAERRYGRRIPEV